jgi:hypothetical protein
VLGLEFVVIVVEILLVYDVVEVLVVVVFKVV